MISIDWWDLLKSRTWFGWYYYGGPMDGYVFARDNRIYWNRRDPGPVDWKSWY